jgi:uncharacterized protein YndB with AHSA1/START domain
MDAAVVTRSINLDASADEVWALVADDAALSDWFGADASLHLVPGGTGRFVDPDGSVRRAVVADVEPGRVLRYTWWDEADPADASTVELHIEADEEGRSTLTVTETVVAGGGKACALAAAEVGDRWDQRLDVVGGLLQRVAPRC